MKRIERVGAALLALVLILCILPLHASANSPGVAPYYTIAMSNLPEGTVYVDMLIKLPETDEKYVDLVKENLPETFGDNAQIITYCDRDYRSYTFHYEDALSDIHVGKSNVKFFAIDARVESNENVRYDHADEIYGRGEIKLAMLDADGNILKVSPPLSLGQEKFMFVPTGGFTYDGETDEFTATGFVSYFGWMLYLLLAIIGMVLTCAVEGLTAKFFGLSAQYVRLIKWTNVASQVLMHGSYVLFYSLLFWKYTYAAVMLEICICLGEFLFYHWKMREISWKKCLAYVLTANTASLAAGLVLFKVILF